MLKLLVKKQLAEMFRGYVYDSKNNRARSRKGTITLFVLFGFLMVVVLGGAGGRGGGACNNSSEFPVSFSPLLLTLFSPLFRSPLGK